MPSLWEALKWPCVGAAKANYSPWGLPGYPICEKTDVYERINSSRYFVKSQIVSSAQPVNILVKR